MQEGIAFLGLLVAVLYVLDRLGVDLGGYNPFHWRRRRSWVRKYITYPIYSVKDPQLVAAILVLGAAKLDGVISVEQRRVALDQFKSTFSLSSQEASEIVGSAMHLLGSPQVIEVQIKGLVEKNKTRLTYDQAESMLSMMAVVCSADGAMTAKQSALVEELRAELTAQAPSQEIWA